MDDKAMMENLNTDKRCIKFLADNARRVFKLIKFRDSIKSKICKTSASLDKSDYKDNLDMEADYDLLKILQETLFGVETSLTELRNTRCKVIEMQKELKSKTIQMKRQERHLRQLKTREILLTKKVAEVKREVRQYEITSKIENDPFLKMAEGECIEILKWKLNVD